MKLVSLLLAVVFTAGACTSIPPQAVTSQELIVSGLESAKANQNTLINAYADDQISQLELRMEHMVIDDVIQESLSGRNALPADELKALLIEYAEDFKTELSSIESTRKQLLKETEAGYAQLIDLANINHEFLRAAHDSSALQGNISNQFKAKLEAVQERIETYVESTE